MIKISGKKEVSVGNMMPTP